MDLMTPLGNQRRSQGRTFDELRSLYETLESAKERCDNLVEARQQSIQTNERTSAETSNSPALQPYLYGDLDVTYPILADCAEFSLCIRRRRRQVVRALTQIY